MAGYDLLQIPQLSAAGQGAWEVTEGGKSRRWTLWLTKHYLLTPDDMAETPGNKQNMCIWESALLEKREELAVDPAVETPVNKHKVHMRIYISPILS